MRPDNVDGVKSSYIMLGYTPPPPTIGIWQPNLEVGCQWQDFEILGKSFLDKRLTVSLQASDIFGSEKVRWHLDHDHVVLDDDKYNDTRYVRLTVQYNFNVTKSKYKGVSSSDEKSRL